MIKELPNNHIAVKIPEDAYDVQFKISTLDNLWTLTYMTTFQTDNKTKHRESWNWKCQFKDKPTILFTTKENVTEEQAKGVVESVDYDVPPSPGNDFQGDWRSAWRDYESDEETGYSEYPYVRTALLSFSSLLRSLNMEGNWAVLKRK